MPLDDSPGGAPGGGGGAHPGGGGMPAMIDVVVEDVPALRLPAPSSPYLSLLLHRAAPVYASNPGGEMLIV